MVGQEACLLLPAVELPETWWANGAPSLFSASVSVHCKIASMPFQGEIVLSVTSFVKAETKGSCGLSLEASLADFHLG